MTLPEEQLDVRPVLASGGSPMDGVLSRWDSLAGGSVLRVIAPFQPMPLIALFSARGVQARCQQAGPEEFHLLLGPKPC
jgi:hypothetical protein